MADTRPTSEARELERISALRATLVITHAFWASLLLPMRMRASSTLPTFAATDCVSTIWINPEWTSTLSLRQLGYVLLHEVGHVALLHALRQGPKGPDIWNISCTTPGAPIVGTDQPIEATQSGDLIYDQHGLSAILKPMHRSYAGRLLTIRAAGLLPIHLTPEHPLLICERQQTSPVHLSPPKWKNANTLQSGDYLTIPRLQGTIDNTHLTLDDFIIRSYKRANNRQIRHGRRLPKPLRKGLPLTTDTAWLMGLYVGDGSSTGNHSGIQFSLGLHETEKSRQIINVGQSLGYMPWQEPRPHDHLNVVKITSRILNRAFAKWFGVGAHHKRIPPFILLHKNPEILHAFVAGLLDSDGYYDKTMKAYQYATVSHHLALQLQLLLARLGTLALLYQRVRRPLTIKNRTVLHPTQQFELTWRPWRTQKKLLNPKGGKPITSFNFMWRVFPNFIATPVRHIITDSYTGPVYNLATRSHSYLLSNAIVHNCDLAINSMLDQVTGGTGRPLYDRPADVDIPGVGQCSLLTPPDWAKDLAAEQIYERLAKEQTNAAHPQGCPGHSRGDSRDTSSHAGNHSENQQNSGNQQTGAPDWSNGHCNPGRTCMQIPIALSPNEAEDLIQRVQAAHEAWVASSQRGTMPAGLARFIDRLRAAKVPWQRVLHQYAGMALAKDDFSLLPPHRRWLADADIIRPSCRSTTLGTLVLAVDTSGSIGRSTLEAFAAEMAKLHTLSEETLILTHDAEIQQAIPTAKVADFLRTLQFKGDGGTSHEPVFEWLKTHRTTPDLLVGLTDLYSAFPARKPPYPVLWCAPEQHGDPPPWGRLVIIPHEDSSR